MKFGTFLANLFERIPEWSIKNDLRYFLAFNRFIPNSIASLSPIKGYTKYRKLQKGDFVVDAGAYPGDYAVWASRKVGSRGKVICFEPNPKNRMILEKNLKKQGQKNFIIVPKGLWDKNTYIKIKNFDGLHTELSSIEGVEEIQVVKLDDELKRLGIKKLNVFKADIEGAEIQAVKGAKKSFRKFKPFISIASYHIVNGKRTSFFLEDFFKKLGYKVKSDYPSHLTTFAWKN